MGKRSKDKGDRGEREAAEFLKKYGFAANRGLGQARGGHEIPDVECEELAYWIEVKRGRHNPVTGYYQAKGYVEEQGDDREPLVMSRRDHCDWLVTVSAEVFFELVAGKTGGVSLTKTHFGEQPLSKAEAHRLAHKLRDPKFYTARTKRAVNSGGAL